MVEPPREFTTTVFGNRVVDVLVFTLLALGLVAAAPRLAVYWSAPRGVPAPANSPEATPPSSLS